MTKHNDTLIKIIIKCSEVPSEYLPTNPHVLHMKHQLDFLALSLRHFAALHPHINPASQGHRIKYR